MSCALKYVAAAAVRCSTLQFALQCARQEYVVGLSCIVLYARRLMCARDSGGTVGFRELETTVFDPASMFLSTH